MDDLGGNVSNGWFKTLNDRWVEKGLVDWWMAIIESGCLLMMRVELRNFAACRQHSFASPFPYRNKNRFKEKLNNESRRKFLRSFTQIIRHYGDKAFCGSKFRGKWVQMEIFRVYLETEAKVELNNCFKLSGCEWKLWKFGKSSKDFYSITAKVGENNRGTL